MIKNIKFKTPLGDAEMKVPRYSDEDFQKIFDKLKAESLIKSYEKDSPLDWILNEKDIQKRNDLIEGVIMRFTVNEYQGMSHF